MRFFKLYHLSVNSILSVEFSFIVFLIANLCSFNTKFSTVLYAVSLIIFLTATKITKVTKGWLILLLFCFSYVFFSIGFNGQSLFNLRYLFFIPYAFQLGVYIASLSKKEIHHVSTLILLSLSLLFISFYDVVVDTIEVGIINKNRIFENNDSTNILATAIGVTKSLSIGLGVGVLFAFRNYIVSKREKVIVIGALTYALFVNIHLLNRTGLVIFFLIFLFLFVKNLKAKSLIFLSILVVILMLSYVKFSNSDGITEVVDAYLNRASKGDQLNGRGALWSKSLNHLITDVGGWYFNYAGEKNRFAHNLWLDVARCSGIISFALFLIFTITSGIDFLRVIISKNITKSFKTILWAVYLSIILQCNVEPVLEASLGYFLTIIFIFGMVHKINRMSYE